eukprot:TRINITY_DN1491_c0_g2_i1.p1 TRINITY_DN1491_c0_g2~~TRINITY_DN1491_c0_g2_i1.p1  ORF type:complete len:180 (-),score=42.59 TRINITY_DN1491_c0_g2_i1:420-959(-)
MKFFLLTAALSLGAVADEPAGATLAETVLEIVNKKRPNNFHTGEAIKGKLNSKKEEVGSCLLDKVDAIIHENGVQHFRNDLLIDLAACCMKDPDACGAGSHIDQAYSFIYRKMSAPAACTLMLEAKTRITDQGRMIKRVRTYFTRWEEAAKALEKEMKPTLCTMGVLTGKDEPADLAEL